MDIVSSRYYLLYLGQIKTGTFLALKDAKIENIVIKCLNALCRAELKQKKMKNSLPISDQRPQGIKTSSLVEEVYEV